MIVHVIFFLTVTGTCDVSRHRITPLDPATPWIGRVDLQDANGHWNVVCDDFWDDIDAHVFCTCLGYAQLVSTLI